MADIAVLGAGGWGMALAILRNGQRETALPYGSPFEEEVKMLSEKRTNERLLSALPCPKA